MNKKLIVTLVLLTVLGLTTATSVSAEEGQTCTQVTQYGGAVSYICGAYTPAKTGIADNLPLVGSVFVGAGAILGYFNRKIKNLA